MSHPSVRNWTYDELETSLRRYGQLAPAFSYGGQLYDGQRRRTICEAQGIPFRVIEAADFEELLSLLFGSHPERAVQLAGQQTIQEYARIFGVNSRSVLSVLRADKEDARIRNPRDLPRAHRGKAKGSGHETQVKFWSTHRWKALVYEAARRSRRSLADYIRNAVDVQMQSDIPPHVRSSFDVAQFTGKNHRATGRLSRR